MMLEQLCGIIAYIIVALFILCAPAYCRYCIEQADAEAHAAMLEEECDGL
jgi:Tfp pilus assembly protein PilE